MFLKVLFVTKDFHGLFSAFFLKKEHKFHMHLRPNHFCIEFLKSIKFVIDYIFSGSESYI